LNINEVQKIFYAQRTEPAKGSTTPNFETTEEKVIRLSENLKETHVFVACVSISMAVVSEKGGNENAGINL
jgi:hypothetical protein